MMTGPLIDAGSIVAGGAIGVLFKRFIPSRVQEGLPPTFALIAVTLGITMVIKAHFLPVVVLSMVIGTVIGELLFLERGIQRGATFIQKSVDRLIPGPRTIPHEQFASQFSAITILFCVSGLGILGSLTEGLSGDYQLLLIKSILDFFTAMTFAMTLGPSVMLIAILQVLVQGSLFFMAKLIMPVMDEAAYADFTACGGVIMLALGLRIAEVKHFAVVNFLPALLLVIPISYLWRLWF